MPMLPGVQAVEKAKFQSGIAALPFSSPQLAVKEQKVEILGRATALPKKGCQMEVA